MGTGPAHGRFSPSVGGIASSAGRVSSSAGWVADGKNEIVALPGDGHVSRARPRLSTFCYAMDRVVVGHDVSCVDHDLVTVGSRAGGSWSRVLFGFYVRAWALQRLCIWSNHFRRIYFRAQRRAARCSFSRPFCRALTLAWQGVRRWKRATVATGGAIRVGTWVVIGLSSWADFLPPSVEGRFRVLSISAHLTRGACIRSTSSIAC